jgi:anthranilate synthase component II
LTERLLILDNYDSFTFNLAHIVRAHSDAALEVIQNDRFDVTDLPRYTKIILSPGPGLPSEAGVMPDVIKRTDPRTPLLGVCLGLQGIAQCYDSKLRNLDTVLHGVAKEVRVVMPDILFEGCPQKFLGGRYHSWVIDEKSLGDELEVTAVDEDGLIMAARHRSRNVRGVQFHPESILSEYGARIISNWLNQG